MYSDRRRYGQKPPRTKSYRQKNPGQKSPDKSPREQLRENLYRGFLSGFFVLGLLKIGGSEMCDILLGGFRGCVTKCDRGRGSKLAKNNMTYFMDDPLQGSSRPLCFCFKSMFFSFRSSLTLSICRTWQFIPLEPNSFWCNWVARCLAFNRTVRYFGSLSCITMIVIPDNAMRGTWWRLG